MIMQHNPSPIRSGRSGRIGVLVVLALAAIAVPCVAWTSHDRLGLEFLGGHTVRFAGHGVDAVGQLRRHLQDHLKGHATDDERWETELEQRLELDRSVKLLRLSTNAGSLAVIPTEGEQVVVRARVTADLDRVDAAECTEVFADHVQVESGEGRLNVSDARSHAGRETKGWSVSLEISLPRALALDVSAGAGSIVVKAATGEVRLKSGAGRIELNTAGRLERLEIGSQAGGVKADVGGVQGEVEVLVGAGAIELSLGHKGSSGDLTVTTRAGGVSVTLPRDVSGHFSMSTPAGSISVDEVFGLEVQRKFASSRCEGQVGASKARLTIESGAGSIELESKETGLVY